MFEYIEAEYIEAVANNIWMDPTVDKMSFCHGFLENYETHIAVSHGDAEFLVHELLFNAATIYIQAMRFHLSGSYVTDSDAELFAKKAQHGYAFIQKCNEVAEVWMHWKDWESNFS